MGRKIININTLRPEKRGQHSGISISLTLFMNLFHYFGTRYHKDFLTLLLSTDSIPNFFPLCLKGVIYGVNFLWLPMLWGLKRYSQHSSQ